MSDKRKLRKAIAESEARIEELEQKRMRSHTAIFYAMLNNLEIPEADKEIFNLNTELIELERKQLASLNDELDELEEDGEDE